MTGHKFDATITQQLADHHFEHDVGLVDPKFVLYIYNTHYRGASCKFMSDMMIDAWKEEFDLTF